MFYRWFGTLLLVLHLAGQALAEPMLSHVDVLTSGKEGYHTFRIPCLVTAPDGSLLAFAEARKYNASDVRQNGLEKYENQSSESYFQEIEYQIVLQNYVFSKEHRERSRCRLWMN